MDDVDSPWANQRRHTRFRVDLPALVLQDGYAVRGRVTNISNGGALFALEPISNVAIRTKALDIEIEGIGRFPAHIRWRAPGSCGIVFQVSEQMRHHLATRIKRLMEAPDTHMRTAATNLPPVAPEAETDATVHAWRTPRRDARHSCTIHARLLQDGFDIPCVVRDISLGGARIAVDASARAALRDSPTRLEIPSFGTYGVEFRWRKSMDIGVRFRLTGLQKRALQEALTRTFAKAQPVRTGG